jgi:hypothetical protein
MNRALDEEERRLAIQADGMTAEVEVGLKRTAFARTTS